MTEEARTFAKAIWQEMLDAGYGDKDETVSDDILDDFLSNQLTDAETWEDAAKGDVASIVRIRTDCGLPIF